MAASASSVAARRPVVYVFSSIRNIGSSLEAFQDRLPVEQIVDSQALQGYGGTVEFHVDKIQASTVKKLQQAEILITEPAVLADLLQAHPVQELFPNLQWVQSTYAGVDPLFRNPHISLPLPFTLTRFAGVFGPPIAEWCIGQIIAHERKFASMWKDQQSKAWVASKEVLEYRYLNELTLTILGVGDIGLCIARAAKAFGMKTVGYSTRVKDDLALDESVTDLKTALQAGDYVVSVLPSTQQTRNILNEEMLAVANRANGGKSPVVLNVGRGDVTTTSTLVKALDRGDISAAILDVFEEEPLPTNNPLWGHPQVTISPHVSGLTQSRDVPPLVLQQYERYTLGEPLQYAVDWNKSY